MKQSTHRIIVLAAVLAALAALAVPIAAAAQAPPAPNATQAQAPPPGAPNPFAAAERAAAAGNYEDALQAYENVFRENNGKSGDDHKQIAAEALYRRGTFAWQSYDPANPDKSHGLDDALQTWRQLRDSMPDTEAAKRLNIATPEYPQGPMAALEAAVNKRNSANFSYKVIDALVALTGRVPSFSYAFALILLAVLVKLLLLPLTKKQYGSMREMQRMQPLIKDLQKRYKGQELQQKQMELYKEHNVNPFAGCLPALLQLPFLYWIFFAIREYEIAFGKGTFLWIGSSLAKQYPSVVAANLATPDIPLLTLYVVTNYITMRMTPAQDPQQQEQQKMMALITSGLFFYMFLSYKWSSAFVLYWFALNLISIWQQYEYVYKPAKAQRLAPAIEAAGASGANGSAAPSKNGGRPEAATAAPPAASIARSQPTRVRPRKKRK